MPRRANLSKARDRAANTTAAETVLSRQNEERSLVFLDKISGRPEGDTRPLNQEHISELVNSISVLGLISPLTVDQNYKLLAGAHRRAALQQLSGENPKRYSELFGNGVPVRIMDFDAETHPVDALQVEVEENTQRRNYTVAEIREAARKLERAGYERLRGRPAPGQKSLNRELMSVFRLSRRRITDILSADLERSEHPCSLLSDLRIYLRRTEKLYESIENPEASKARQRLHKNLEKLISNLKVVIKEEEKAQG